MKSITSIIFTLALNLGTVNFSQAQDVEPKEKNIKIKTAAVCVQCKERIETNMAYEKGVKSVELDKKTKIVTITYKSVKTNPEKLRKAISELGYDADDVEADTKAYTNLPACCKKDVKQH